MKNRGFLSWTVLAIGLLLMMFFQIGIIRWYNSGRTINDFVSAITQDWLLLITFIDAGFFTILCIGWLIYDLNKNRNASNLKWIWLALTLVFGSPIVMFYLFTERRV
jgi:hypothetical protein